MYNLSRTQFNVNPGINDTKLLEAANFDFTSQYNNCCK